MAWSPLEIGAAGALTLLVLGLLGVRIAYAAAFVGLFGLIWILGWDIGLRTAGTIPHSKGVSYSLSVLPMFILIGYLAHYAGITQAAFEACRRWFGWLPGGLATATVLAVAAFGAVSGSSAAAAAVFSRVAIPEMLKEGYSKALAGGSVAAGSVLDSLIPPSTLLVVYAILTDQSVGKLLVAGFVPGVFSAFVYVLLITFMATVKPEIGPRTRHYSWSERFRSIPGVIPVLLVIMTVFTAMLFGWATPTEAGALAAFFVFVLAIINRTRLSEFRQALLETAKLTVVVFTLVWSIMIFVLFLGFANLPTFIADWVTSLNMSPLMVMICIYILYIILGMFVDALGMMLLTLPVVFPLVVSLGYDPIWFGVVLVKLCGIGLLSPPFGLLCFIVNGVRPDIPVQTVFKGVMPFIAADLIVVGILTAYPEIVTFIVDIGR
ncbi:MAG: TRAP transporter large permease [Rhodobiaceae bacterium]|nr:TRAP transporter large permease [Rhodobiaceae bacterium]MCC0056272.1 TRAP transporter large permease [Rhodobiaceae bacterium]